MTKNCGQRPSTTAELSLGVTLGNVVTFAAQGSLLHRLGGVSQRQCAEQHLDLARDRTARHERTPLVGRKSPRQSTQSARRCAGQCSVGTEETPCCLRLGDAITSPSSPSQAKRQPLSTTLDEQGIIREFLRPSTFDLRPSEGVVRPTVLLHAHTAARTDAPHQGSCSAAHQTMGAPVVLGRQPRQRAPVSGGFVGGCSLSGRLRRSGVQRGVRRGSAPSTRWGSR